MPVSQKTPHVIAIDILSRRDNSVHEMRMKLKRKGISQDDVDETITWLENKKLIDDRIFAQKRAESIFRTKLVGPKFIQSKLREAGITGEICDEVLDELATPEEWGSRAHKAIEQWQRIHPKHAEDGVRKMRFLASRGFDRATLVSTS